MPSEENNGFTKREMTKMLIGYMKERVTTLEGREKYYVITLIIVVCAFAGVKIGVI